MIFDPGPGENSTLTPGPGPDKNCPSRPDPGQISDPSHSIPQALLGADVKNLRSPVNSGIC